MITLPVWEAFPTAAQITPCTHQILLTRDKTWRNSKTPSSHSVPLISSNSTFGAGETASATLMEAWEHWLQAIEAAKAAPATFLPPPLLLSLPSPVSCCRGADKCCMDFAEQILLLILWSIQQLFVWAGYKKSSIPVTSQRRAVLANYMALVHHKMKKISWSWEPVSSVAPVCNQYMLGSQWES